MAEVGVVLKVPQSTHTHLKEACAKHDRSMQKILLSLIEGWVANGAPDPSSYGRKSNTASCKVMTNFPISPPPELVSDWRLAPEYTDGLGKPTMVTITVDRLQYIATQAARWGADQELEACCEWFVRDWTDIETTDKLRADRRPKPPSLKEQALKALEDGDTGPGASLTSNEVDIIRRALEALPND